MATRSTIAVVHEDGSVSQVYCHYDGYLENNGDILHKHYTFRDRVEALVKLGDLSSLGTYIQADDVHSHAHPQEDVCVFYGRDRGEEGVEPLRFQTLDEYYRDHQSEEYNYLFRDGKWLVQCDYQFPKFTLLTEAFEIAAAKEAE